MTRALITGIHGFAGSHLCAEVLRRGGSVCGLDRSPRSIADLASTPALQGLDRKHIEANVKLETSDLSDADQLRSILESHGVHQIYHLAGMAFVPDSWNSPATTLHVNSACALNLLQAARDVQWDGRFLFISSSDVYGTPRDGELPLNEASPIRTESPYALSKYTTENFAWFYDRKRMTTLTGGRAPKQHCFDVVVARPFNHIGPGQREDFVVPAFLAKIRSAKAKNEDFIQVGELGAVRDFTDVRDVVSAYVLLLDKADAGEIYNICTGRQIRISEILDTAQKVAGYPVEYRISEDLLRPEGKNQRYGDPAKLRDLGWEHRYSLEDSIRDMWNCFK